jgi:sigma-B regulation protein RsbU (phosphoserine phosphatase)
MVDTGALSSDFKYRLLLDISQKTSRTFDLEEVLAELLKWLRMVVDYDAAGIFVLSRRTPIQADPEIVIAGAATVGFGSSASAEDAMMRFGRGIVGHVIATGEHVVARDVRTDPRYVRARDTTLSEIAVPIVANDHIIGALNLESDRVAAYSRIHVEILEFFAQGAAMSIEKAMLLREVLARQRIGVQLALAQQVQANLLPTAAPEVPGYDLAGINVPSSEIGGDYYDYIPLDGGRLAVVVADVAGKGIAAALVMAGFRAALRTELRRHFEPADLVGVLHQHVLESAGLSRFVTAVYAVLDPPCGTLCYVNCGHNPPIVLRASGAHDLLGSGGPPLGLSIPMALAFECGRVTLGLGDALVLYTDAVVELTDARDEDFGTGRLVDALRRTAHRPARNMLQAVIDEIREFSGSDGYRDDFTLVVVKRLAEGPAS